MLAGRPPFEGDSPESICHKHIHDPPPSLTDSVPGLPVSVEKLVHRCLQKNPRKRFQTPRELRLALEELLEAERTDQATAEMPPPMAAWTLRQRPPVQRERLRSRMLYVEAPRSGGNSTGAAFASLQWRAPWLRSHWPLGWLASCGAALRMVPVGLQRPAAPRRSLWVRLPRQWWPTSEKTATCTWRQRAAKT